MGRPRGLRNADYDEQRDLIARRCLPALAAPGGPRASLRTLAGAAGVSLTTLRHYFATREALVRQALDVAAREEAPVLADLAAGPVGPLEPSLREALRQFARRFARTRHAHVVGLGNGSGDPALGPAYVAEILDPLIECVALRLDRHRLAGQLGSVDLQAAALALVGPVLLALLHQRALGGMKVRRIAIDRLIDEHVARWIAGWAAPARRA